VNTPQEHDREHEQREGMGERVRRFLDAGMSRVLDKEDKGAGTRTAHQGDLDPADRGDAVDRADDSRPAQETQQAHEPEQERYSEPVDPGTSGPGYAERPATTAPYDAGREPKLQPAGPEESRGQSGDQLAAEGSAARVGLLNDVAGLRDEWQRVQGTFVDDPQRAVHEASALIDRALEEIRANVGSKHPSETTSTEELRVSFQRYREFFQRLLSA
jgi:hypothetical protein